MLPEFSRGTSIRCASPAPSYHTQLPENKLPELDYTEHAIMPSPTSIQPTARSPWLEPSTGLENASPSTPGSSVAYMSTDIYGGRRSEIRITVDDTSDVLEEQHNSQLIAQGNYLTTQEPTSPTVKTGGRDSAVTPMIVTRKSTIRYEK